MPDLLAHYVASYLIARSVVRSRFRALLLALIGIAPDLDVVAHIHRSATHSLVLSLILAFPIFISSFWFDTMKRMRVVIALAILLYVLHLVMDLFTGYVPILWPLTDRSYYLDLRIEFVSSELDHPMNISIHIASTRTQFVYCENVGGSIAALPGIILAITAIILESMQELEKRCK